GRRAMRGSAAFWRCTPRAGRWSSGCTPRCGPPAPRSSTLRSRAERAILPTRRDAGGRRTLSRGQVRVTRPGALREQVDAIRARWNPELVPRNPAHATVIYHDEAQDPALLRA